MAKKIQANMIILFVGLSWGILLFLSLVVLVAEVRTVVNNLYWKAKNSSVPEEERLCLLDLALSILALVVITSPMYLEFVPDKYMFFDGNGEHALTINRKWPVVFQSTWDKASNGEMQMFRNSDIYLYPEDNTFLYDENGKLLFVIKTSPLGGVNTNTIFEMARSMAKNRVGNFDSLVRKVLKESGGYAKTVKAIKAAELAEKSELDISDKARLFNDFGDTSVEFRKLGLVITDVSAHWRR